MARYKYIDRLIDWIDKQKNIQQNAHTHAYTHIYQIKMTINQTC